VGVTGVNAYIEGMSNSNNSASGGGMGLAGVLTVIFIVLKLVGVINWSWIWVLSPLWIGFVVAVVVIALFAWLAS